MKTAESVSPSHPDKLCDQISDAILDACLVQDPMSRVAMEVMGGHGSIDITGELTTNAYVDMREIALRVAGKGYGIKVNVVRQSPEIAQGVDTGGAGDQGIMCGYACSENEDMIPQELFLARSLCKFLYGKFPYDGKTQITIDTHGAITAIVASFQNTTKEDLKIEIERWLSQNSFKHFTDVEMILNAAGNWSIGGFEADTGLTGRKLMVDNYGPQIAIGGGCFSGKDATKVDRSAAYMARKMAVEIVKHRKGHYPGNWASVKLAYAIGVAQPVMVSITTDAGEWSKDEVDRWVKGYNYDLTPKGIINYLELRKPQFEETARFGHFGNGFLWDK